MTQPTSLDTSAALRSIGVNRGTDLPALQTGLQQVIVMSDLSKNFAQQQFEARGFATAVIAASVPNLSICQLIVNSPGGVVIERIDIFSEDAVPVPALRCGFQTGQRQTFIGPTNAQVIDVGGVATRSILEQGHILIPGTIAIIELTDGFKTFENFGWFIPSGSVMRVQTAIPDTALTCTIQWRELPQAA